MSLFLINIQINQREIITLDTKCSRNTNIYELKRIIINERNLKNMDNIRLKYNGIFMENNKTLNDYKIYDSKHIIKLYFNVTECKTISMPIKQYSNFISNFSTSTPLIIKSKSKNHSICNRRRRTQLINIILAVLVLSILAIYIISGSSFIRQHKVYREYSKQPNDCVLLNEICNDQCIVFQFQLPNENGDLHSYDAATNFTWYCIGTFGHIIILIILLIIILLTKHDICGCCGYCSASLLLGFWFVVYIIACIYGTASIKDAINVGKLCNPDSKLYDIIYKKWYVFNNFTVIMNFCLIPIVVGISCFWLAFVRIHN